MQAAPPPPTGINKQKWLGKIEARGGLEGSGSDNRLKLQPGDHLFWFSILSIFEIRFPSSLLLKVEEMMVQTRRIRERS
ncbi:unnamed protein product [Linum trigynum]|uniref:Uncharacterized protein n=1 Tax=Linum trigynum TaxID=586398 RepID=A0AAV2FDH6_9ROSI